MFSIASGITDMVPCSFVIMLPEYIMLNIVRIKTKTICEMKGKNNYEKRKKNSYVNGDFIWSILIICLRRS